VLDRDAPLEPPHHPPSGRYIRPIANLLSSKVLRWKLEKSKILSIAQNSPNSPKNLPISNPVAKVQKLSKLKGTVTDRPIIFTI
jgi:hypothetical protein